MVTGFFHGLYMNVVGKARISKRPMKLGVKREVLNVICLIHEQVGCDSAFV
jgi:hypothetical protein